jgi:hypothetical protein
MSAPIFASVFGAAWTDLPPALRKHYANRPFTRDRVTVTGRLDIRMGWLMRRIAPLMGALGMLTPADGAAVPCTVQFLSEADSAAFIFERRFLFPGRKPYVFRSRLVRKRGSRVVEYMACGVGWDCEYSFADGEVRLRHRGYVWRWFGADLPIGWLATPLLGRGEAVERATGEDAFAMSMRLGGGLFGDALAYAYAGRFTVTEMAADD